jgi:uncharacterized protein with HEPN domain
MDRDEATLDDIRRAARLALAFAGDAPGPEALERDVKTQSAVLHQLLVLGEAVKRLSPAFRAARPDVPWREIAGMRDILIHAYDAVDFEAVWRVLDRELPALLAQLDADPST